MTAEDRAATCPHGSEIATLGGRVGSLEERMENVEQTLKTNHVLLDDVRNDVSFIRGRLENGSRFTSKDNNDKLFLIIIVALAAVVAALVGVTLPV